MRSPSSRPIPPLRAAPRAELSVSTSPLPNSRLGLEITAGPEECSAAWTSVLTELSKRCKIDGFRKGKAPQALVINQYGKSTIAASACEEVIEKSIQKALDKEGVSAIGQAVLDDACKIDDVIAAYAPEKSITFKVMVDVWPVAELTGDYTGLNVTADRAPFDESVVVETLEGLQRKEAFTVLSPEGTKAEIGKVCIANMVGFYRKEDGKRGEALPDIASGDMIEIKMQIGQYMPGFVEGIVGMECGDMRAVNVEFPVQSSRPELAGQKAVFDVTLHAVKDEVLPDLDDDFAKNMTESPTLEALKDTIRERMSVESANKTKANVDRALEDALVAITKVELPETMVENRIKDKFANFLSDMKSNGMTDTQVKALVTKENYDLYKERARANVERALTANFAIQAIAEKEKVANGISVSNQEVDDQLLLIRGELKNDQEYSDNEESYRDKVRAQLEKDAVLAFLKESATVTLQDVIKETPETAPVEA